MASSGPTDYTFNYDHRLSAIGSSAAFSYDGRGNRLRAVRGGVTTRYVHDAAGNLLAEADGSNNILRYYIHGAGLLAMVTPANDLYCYHFDALGSTVAVTNASQTMVNRYAYDVFGNVKNQMETIAQPFKYVGQFGVMAEPEGFYYMRARYYDPTVGRFISQDPIGFDGGDVNLSAYASNNPIILSDPFGLRSWGVFAGVNLTALTGIEGSFSIVWNTGLTKGERADLGIQFTWGAASGVNVGGAAGVQTYNGNVNANDGPSLNLAGGGGPVALNAAVDLKSGEITGGSLGFGTPTRMPLAVSLGYDQTTTFSVRGDLIPAIQGLFGSSGK